MTDPAFQITVGNTSLPVLFVRNFKARRYVMRFRNGGLRVTLPRGGNVAEAIRFVERNRPWIEKQLLKHPSQWSNGATVLLRGEPIQLIIETNGNEKVVLIGPHRLYLDLAVQNVRPPIERFLVSLALVELVPKTKSLSERFAIPVSRITIRNQRSRWGSCSARRTISLNWRLIQTPPSVQEYIIIHELMHLHEMNHSDRFWARVAEACPTYKESERWLRDHSSLLH